MNYRHAYHAGNFADVVHGDAGAEPWLVDLAQLDAVGRPGRGCQREHQVTIWCAIEKPRFSRSSAWIRCTTALI